MPLKAGEEVTLTNDNWHIYQDILERYERNSVQKNGDQFVINGEETNQYTIQKNYYFVMGDNRDDSEDSRYWGFVPDDHISWARRALSTSHGTASDGCHGLTVSLI